MSFVKSDIRDGMVVRSKNGEELGRVSRYSDDEFEIEQGFFFAKHYWAHYNQIDQISENQIFLGQTSMQLSPFRSESFEGWKEQEQRYPNRAELLQPAGMSFKEPETITREEKIEQDAGFYHDPSLRNDKTA